jgi:hypothetical protein
MNELVPIHKWLICPISALHEKFNPRNISHMPAVKFSGRLDLEQIILFVDGHELISILRAKSENPECISDSCFVVNYIIDSGVNSLQQPHFSFFLLNIYRMLDPIFR